MAFVTALLQAVVALFAWLRSRHEFKAGQDAERADVNAAAAEKADAMGKIAANPPSDDDVVSRLRNNGF